MSIKTFEQFESNVRTYCRDFPAVFASAKNHLITDIHGNTYTDLLAGAGALNYGHNNPTICTAVVDYLKGDGIAHSLDMYTEAKEVFIDAFVTRILKPRSLDYKLQFTGPTGTNAVEASLKLARKITGRTEVVAFTGGYHGMTLGSLAATSNESSRAGAGQHLSNVLRLPYEGYVDADCFSYFEKAFQEKGSGLTAPACFLVETVQGEGGLRSASVPWLKRLAELAKKTNSLLIIDDIQAGCGRTGDYFSFEEAGIYPDMVCLSKSISGMGLPMALLLLKPEHDIWAPGEHNGTFRGNNLAFVAATASLELWSSSLFQSNLKKNIDILDKWLRTVLTGPAAEGLEIRGRGLMRGLSFYDKSVASEVSRICFDNKVIVEKCGPYQEVLKILPPLTIPEESLISALDVIDAAVVQSTLGASTLEASAAV